MAYNHKISLHKNKKRESAFRKIVFAVTIFAVFFGLVITVDWFINQISNSNTVVSRENTTSVQSANVSVYRSDYFQFQAPNDWVYVSNESTPNKFVYVKNVGSLVKSMFKVYINRPAIDVEADFQASYVLPVRMGVLNNFDNIGKVSSHCNKSWPNDLPSGIPARIIHEKVSFVCTPDSQQYNVVIGEEGGSETIEVELNNGKKINLTLVFKDLTAYPGPGDIYDIISSFNTL